MGTAFHQFYCEPVPVLFDIKFVTDMPTAKVKYLPTFSHHHHPFMWVPQILTPNFTPQHFFPIFFPLPKFFSHQFFRFNFSPNFFYSKFFASQFHLTFSASDMKYFYILFIVPIYTNLVFLNSPRIEDLNYVKCLNPPPP